MAIATAVLYLATSLAGLIKQRYDNKRLKSKLRRALMDCRTFYEIEARLCEACATCYSLGSDSPLATKINVRRAVVQDGMSCLSEYATPRRIAQELEKL